MDTRLAQASEETVAQIVTPVDQAELAAEKARLAAEKAELAAQKAAQATENTGETAGEAAHLEAQRKYWRNRLRRLQIRQKQSQKAFRSRLHRFSNT